MVVQCDYCITLDRIPEDFYPDIVANQAQHDEWVRLFAIDEIKGDAITAPYSNPLTVEFLKTNPFLVLDTKFFDLEWKYRLLAAFDNIGQQCDGLLINSDNFHALNLLQKRHIGNIDCIHIDPPYNTDTSGFLYKNNYRHASWMSMMNDRLSLSTRLMASNAAFACHIDENEYERLRLLFNETELTNVGTVVWDKRNPMTGGSGIANQHEYIIWQSKSQLTLTVYEDNAKKMIDYVQLLIGQYGVVNDDLRREYANWVNQNDELSGGEKAYRFIDDQGRIYQSVSLRAPEPRTDPKFFEPLIHPITRKPCAIPPNGFSRTPDTLKKMIEDGLILFGRDETTQPRQKMFLSKEKKRQMTSLIQNGMKGKADTDKLGVNFPYCHPVSLYFDL
jgi:adenine-specific DNA-methyltransferase